MSKPPPVLAVKSHKGLGFGPQPVKVNAFPAGSVVFTAKHGVGVVDDFPGAVVPGTASPAAVVDLAGGGTVLVAAATCHLVA